MKSKSLRGKLVEELKAERLKLNARRSKSHHGRILKNTGLKAERNESLEDEIINDISQNVNKIRHHGKRASDNVKGILQHYLNSTGEKESTNINIPTDEYLRLIYHGLRAKDKFFNAGFSMDLDETNPPINVTPQDIGWVLFNLINNAFYSVNDRAKMEDVSFKPTVTVSTKMLDQEVIISLKDNGPSIPADIKDKIFQPFFNTKPTGQGTGLGLSLSYDIVKAHRGALNVKSKEGESTEFIIQLPYLIHS